MASTTLPASRMNGSCSLPSSTCKVAPGTSAATSRECCGSTTGSCRLVSTRVGVRIFDSASPASCWRISSSSETAISGVAAARSELHEPVEILPAAVGDEDRSGGDRTQPPVREQERLEALVRLLTGQGRPSGVRRVEHQPLHALGVPRGEQARPPARPRSSRSGSHAPRRWRRGPPSAARRRSRPRA